MEQAHDPARGRLELHPWLVIYPMWSAAAGYPGATNHLSRLHPEWLMTDRQGETCNGRGYFLNPAHPEVRAHLFRVAMDVAEHYDVDRLNLDYVHYPVTGCGFNPVTVARVNRRYRRRGEVFRRTCAGALPDDGGQQ